MLEIVLTTTVFNVAIETDGTITPHEALESAIHTMITQLQSVVGFVKIQSRSVPQVSATVVKEKENRMVMTVQRQRLKTSASQLEHSMHSSEEIKTAGGLARKSESDLLSFGWPWKKELQKLKSARKYRSFA